MINIVILGDGMADAPYASDKTPLKTPLAEAVKPVIDGLAPLSEIGLVRTVPKDMKPGSDVANLSVLGYDPAVYYTGRSPLEAVSIGINMRDGDLALRANLVTLSPYAFQDENKAFGERIMLDYSADEISTEDARVLIRDLQKHFNENNYNLLKDFAKDASGFERFTFYGGVSYRNCLIISEGIEGTFCTPPHDISGQKIGDKLPRGVYGEQFTELMKASFEFLSRHPFNLKRIVHGKKPANAVWLWGEGKKPKLEDFYKLYRKKGAVVSAVDLIKGIGLSANMKIYEVAGATGNIDTNFKGKADAVIQAVKDGCDFVYLHIEAADECGHRGERANKILAIEKIDGVVGVLKKELDGLGKPYALLVLPDHPTPLSTRTHSSDPVPYLMYSPTKTLASGILKYDEISAEAGVGINSGKELLKRFLSL